MDEQKEEIVVANEKKKKKKSWTARLNEARESIRYWEKRYDEQWKRFRSLRDRIEEIDKVYPKKYFKIKFKIKANLGHEVETEEIIEDFSLNLAIITLKKNKTFPDSFQLVDVKILN
jgi:hypothetical protein